MRRCEIRLQKPIPGDLLEEVLTKLPFCTEAARNFEIEAKHPDIVAFQIPDDSDQTQIALKLESFVKKMIAGWRTLPARVTFDKKSLSPPYRGDIWQALQNRGLVRLHAPGQVSLTGMPLALYHYFDRCFTNLGSSMGGTEVHYPQMIGIDVLKRCEYFSSFPHHVTFCSHLREDADLLNDFSTAQQEGTTFPFATGLHPPEYIVTPAVCFHAYHSLADSEIDGPRIVTTAARCFRFESTAMTTLERLWDFTMREIVFIGPADWVRERRNQSIDRLTRFVEELELQSWIETANDPFFVNNFVAKKYHQLLTEAKYELKLCLPFTGGALAAASFNYHEDFFGRSFAISLKGTPIHTACTAFGLERWVFAFLSQYGLEPEEWPAKVRDAICPGARANFSSG